MLNAGDLLNDVADHPKIVDVKVERFFDLNANIRRSRRR
jgi:hypothetical protein